MKALVSFKMCNNMELTMELLLLNAKNMTYFFVFIIIYKKIHVVYSLKIKLVFLMFNVILAFLSEKNLSIIIMFISSRVKANSVICTLGNFLYFTKFLLQLIIFKFETTKISCSMSLTFLLF